MHLLFHNQVIRRYRKLLTVSKSSLVKLNIGAGGGMALSVQNTRILVLFPFIQRSILHASDNGFWKTLTISSAGDASFYYNYLTIALNLLFPSPLEGLTRGRFLSVI